MAQTVEAVYEKGVLHLLQPLEGIAEHCRVKVMGEVATPPHPLAGCIGIVPEEDAADANAPETERLPRVTVNQ